MAVYKGIIDQAKERMGKSRDAYKRDMMSLVPRADVVGVDPRLERQGSAGKTGSSGME